MDKLYYAIKNVFQAFINLFAAVIDLFTGFLNRIAFLLERLCPKGKEIPAQGASSDSQPQSARKDAPLLRIRRSAGLLPDDGNGKYRELLAAVRLELSARVTDGDQYILTELALQDRLLRKWFFSRRKRLAAALALKLLEEEIRPALQEVKAPPQEETAEKAKIQPICELGKEAIG